MGFINQLITGGPHIVVLFGVFGISQPECLVIWGRFRKKNSGEDREDNVVPTCNKFRYKVGPHLGSYLRNLIT